MIIDIGSEDAKSLREILFAVVMLEKQESGSALDELSEYSDIDYPKRANDLLEMLAEQNTIFRYWP